MKKRTHDEQLEHAYYAGFVRLFHSRPQGEEKADYINYIADAFKLDREEFTEYQKIKEVEFHLMSREDKVETRRSGEIYRQMYPAPEWAVSQTLRGAMMEDICEHGVGHPNVYWTERRKKFRKHRGLPEERYASTHGCDGCCMLPSNSEITETWKDE